MRSGKGRRAFAALVLLGLLGTGCSLADSKTNEVGLVFSGGITQDRKFIACLPSGANSNSIGAGNTYVVYRTDQRSFIAATDKDGNPAEGADTVEPVVVSKDNIRLTVPYQLYFKLNQECDPEKAGGGTLVAFHNNLGTKNEAWVGGEGDPKNPADGWTEMLHATFRPQIERSLERAALQHPWLALYSSEEARNKMQADTVTYLKEALREVVGAGADYFCGPGYEGPIKGSEEENAKNCGDFSMTIGKPTPVDAGVAAGLEGAEANRGKVAQQEQENARAAKELEQRQKEIDALGPDNYVLLEGIRSGKVSVMVVPRGTNAQIPLPAQR
jgi:hypothetical protein